ncbi:S1 domain-containing protein [Chitinophaga arvensicola]|uniref:Ribonuclease B OB domain-containing protein n=1 Tax=Chitinophaga arvensicola TaxID=29529 RepID=A0A1I0S9B9_9BACT|nr:hypothetical protein [Chitinophaga arvensicola]SEW51622.1 Ribonuclease B OB domain-containing protein [Chitinophaga arvensicola]
MEELVYNVLWIDDEHEALSGTKGRAKRNNINLVSFKSLDGGMSELERNFPFYDGVLLDAKFFINEDDAAGTEDTSASFRAKERILQLPKKFEIFVLTGQAEAYGDKTFKKVFINVYDKGNDDDMIRLFHDMKTAADGQLDTQIRHSYKRVFDVCTERYLGEVTGQDLLSLLKVTEELNLGNSFNSVRKVMEDLFVAFHKYNLLPTEFVSPSIAMNECSRFLAGKSDKDKYFIEKGYEHSEETHLPRQIAYCIRVILHVTQSGSHRSDVDMHVKLVKTPYLFRSILFQLMDVLVWFKMYVDASPQANNWRLMDREKTNIAETVTDLIPGKVINFNSDKGFAFFKPDFGDNNTYIPPHLVSHNSLVNGSTILVEIEEYDDDRNGGAKTRVKRIEVR